jgi:hypothetical protein
MVFVLGVLVLLALLGLLLIARTHGEAKRVANESTASSQQALLDGIVRTVRETLRRDIWGQTPPTGTTDVPLGDDLGLAADPSIAPVEENNEPYDAPGPCDRWLASTLPYYAVENDVQPPASRPYPYNLENSVLVWHRVSYLGSDVLQGAGGSTSTNPFRWRFNSRSGVSLLTVAYGDQNLASVPILQKPPDAFAGTDLVPGSTTNVTIAVGRRLWERDALTPAECGLATAPRYPYFDTNADGILDLYDADGDGIPDSPISFVVPVETTDPNAPKQLYAAIRIVDHASMLNVNTAYSLRLRQPADSLTFDDSVPDRQRRGRRTTELLLDELTQPSDTTAGLVDRRSAGCDNPTQYDRDVVRRDLIGGWKTLAESTDPNYPLYRLYGLRDEASLRHRGMLVPPDCIYDRVPPPAYEFCGIDRALPGTLLWSRTWKFDSTPPRYDPDVWPRSCRLNSNYVDLAAYEGYDDPANPAIKGWRSLLREDEPYAVRRQLFTTVSREVVPPISGLHLCYDALAAKYFVTEDELCQRGLPVTPVRIVSGPNPTTDVYMDWPILQPQPQPDPFPNVPDAMRILPIDLNMSSPTADEAVTKQRYMQYLAAAMYMALRGVELYQGFNLAADPLLHGPQNREYLAWQFAANVADYRDSDGNPTILQWFYDPGHPTDPTFSRFIFGVEKQPFLTEAYAALWAGLEGSTGPVPESAPQKDEWFFAVELYVPPMWHINTQNLYLRGKPSGPLLQLNSFLLPSGGPLPTVLNGGNYPGPGAYYVLCGGSNGAIPAGLNVSGFYRNNALSLDTNGNGTVELIYSLTNNCNPAQPCVVLDTINPAHSNGTLANGTPPVSDWAKRVNIDPGQRQAWSLLRSTKGWRFTTAWQVCSKQLQAEGGLPPFRPSLGSTSGNVTPELDNNIPESVWPTLVSTNTPDHEPKYPAGGSLVDGFRTGQPFEAFDSVPEISRMLMVGPIHREPQSPPYFGCAGVNDQNLPVPLLLAQTLMMPPGDLPQDVMNPGQTTPKQGMIGRMDFVSALPVTAVGNSPTLSAPWTWRLLEYLTTQSPVYDGVDNDGNGLLDMNYTDPNTDDRGEGVRVLNRVAGRININTAPVSVLRTVPYMSMLPTSPEYKQHIGSAPNPASEFTTHPERFWDFASAIVAQREERRVPLRLPNNTGGMQTVATAETIVSVMHPEPPIDTFFSMGSLMSSVALNEQLPMAGNMYLRVQDASGGHNYVFATDRFWDWDYRNLLLLYEHAVLGGSLASLSPDYRFRTVAAGRLVDYLALGNTLPGQPYDNGGLRARDIFLTRWANLLTTRSDVFTAYIALLDENGRYVQRSQVTLDRSNCFRENPADPLRRPILPEILLRLDGSYADDTR